MLRKPGQNDGVIRKVHTSTRRKTQESPDDSVRKLQRLPSNKKCADCTAKLPSAANLTHGTFVCMACSGAHREFNHRIKGIGHSSFTAEEASFLSANGNDVVNAKLLAKFNNNSGFLRAPDGSVTTVDGQVLRVWLRRKYIDCEWQTRDNDTKINSNASSSKASNGYQAQATKAKIPSKKTKPAPPTVDLLGDIFAEAAPTPPAAPVDDGWNAFGGSTSNTSVQAPFQANFVQGNQTTPSQQQPNFPANTANSPHSNYQPTFDQANFNQTSQPMQQQGLANLPHQQPTSHPPTQYQQTNFNANFPPQVPVQQQGSSGAAQPVFQGNFQAAQSGLQQPPTQTQSQPNFNANFSTPHPGNQQAQPQHATPTHQQTPGFNANFQNTSIGNQPNPAVPSGSQHPQLASPINQQVQNPAYPQVQPQTSYSANVSGVQPGNQQQHAQNSMAPPQQQQQFQVVQSGLQQQQQTQPTQTQPQPSFNADFPTGQPGNQQEQPQPVVPQENPGFNANFQTASAGIQQHNTMPPGNQQLQSVPTGNQQIQISPSNAGHQQPGLNSSFVQQQNAQQTFPGVVSATQQGIMPQTQPGMQSGYQQPHTSVPAPQQNNSGMASGYQQQQPQTAPLAPQQQLDPTQQLDSNLNYQLQQQGHSAMPPPQQPPPIMPDDAHVNNEGAMQSEASNHQQRGFSSPDIQNGNAQFQNIDGPAQEKDLEMPSDPRLPQQGNLVSKMNGNDSSTFQTQNTMPPTGDPIALNTFDAFSGLGLAPSDTMGTQNDIHKEITDEIIPNVELKKIESKYHVGQKIVYRDSRNNMSTVEIMNIHHDDTLVPFYTIKMPDGREKQTDDKHLSTSENVSEGLSNVDSVHMPQVQQQSFPKIDEIVSMLHNLNEGQLAAVQQFIIGMSQPTHQPNVSLPC